MPTLTVAMIVKDEESQLPRCLASLRGLADEIVVVDTGSTDRTVEIAREFGARVGHFAWCDDFASARNESLRLATGDWVLVLDADEAVDPLDHARVRELLRDEGPGAYRVPIRSYLPSASHTTLDQAPTPNRSEYSLGGELPYYTQFSAVRLMRRFPGLEFSGRIHELPDPSLAGAGVVVSDAAAVIHHFGKTLASRESHKRGFYLRLTEEEARRDPSPRHQFNRAIQAFVAEDWRACREASEAYLRDEPAAPYVILLAAGTALSRLGQPAEALAWLDRLLAAEPRHAPALTQKAQALAALGRFQEARDTFQSAMLAQPEFVMPYLNLAELEAQLGDPEAALGALRRGVAVHPQDERLRGAIIQLELRLYGVAQAASRAWEAIQAIPHGGGGDWHRLVGAALLEAGQAASAGEILRMGLAAFPNNVGLSKLLSLCR